MGMYIQLSVMNITASKFTHVFYSFICVLFLTGVFGDTVTVIWRTQLFLLTNSCEWNADYSLICFMSINPVLSPAGWCFNCGSEPLPSFCQLHTTAPKTALTGFWSISSYLRCLLISKSSFLQWDVLFTGNVMQWRLVWKLSQAQWAGGGCSHT